MARKWRCWTPRPLRSDVPEFLISFESDNGDFKVGSSLILQCLSIQNFNLFAINDYGLSWVRVSWQDSHIVMNSKHGKLYRARGSCQYISLCHCNCVIKSWSLYLSSSDGGDVGFFCWVDRCMVLVVLQKACTSHTPLQRLLRTR